MSQFCFLSGPGAALGAVKPTLVLIDMRQIMQLWPFGGFMFSCWTASPAQYKEGRTDTVDKLVFPQPVAAHAIVYILHPVKSSLQRLKTTCTPYLPSMALSLG